MPRKIARRALNGTRINVFIETTLKLRKLNYGTRRNGG